METALGELTNLNSFIRPRTDRRSLVSVSDANTEQRGVGLFAIASHFVVPLTKDLNVTDYARKFVCLFISKIYNTLEKWKKIIIDVIFSSKEIRQL